MKIDRLTPDAAMLAELGARLARIRKQRGHSQEALAREAGVGVATLRRIEDGKDGKLGSWLRILKALDMAAAVDGLLPEDLRSPMAEAKQQAAGRGKKSSGGGDFVWGDERK